MTANTPLPAGTKETNIILVLGAVMSVILLASLGQTIVTTALPIIVGDLGGLEHISWAITAYLLAATIAAPLCGKLGDMFGRKIILQAGILIFLAGSGLAALSWDMTTLVLARVVQGFGGGGLIVTAMASVGDFVAPRQRGKMQSFVGATFGLSTVIGPLLGGVIVEHFAWRWLFLVNLPVGIMALLVIAMAFPERPERIKRKIDYAGAALLATMLSSLVLYTSVGGTILPWLSPAGLALVAISLISLACFVIVEQRAQEPILPLFLFRNNAFIVSNGVGFAVGVVMFGSITFIPFFLQIVKGLAPTQAGLGLVPMMMGLIVSSAVTGIIMSRTGRYRILPIISTAILCLGTILMSTIGPETDVLIISSYMVLVGLGIGPVMSVGVTAIQNAVPHHVLGVGTASANMFRQIGGSVGVAVLGAVFANRLGVELAVNGSSVGQGSVTVESIAALSEPAREAAINAYAMALHPVFWCAAVVAAMAFALSWCLKEVPLAESVPGATERDEPELEGRPVQVGE